MNRVIPTEIKTQDEARLGLPEKWTTMAIGWWLGNRIENTTEGTIETQSITRTRNGAESTEKNVELEHRSNGAR